MSGKGKKRSAGKSKAKEPDFKVTKLANHESERKQNANKNRSSAYVAIVRN